MLIIQLLAVLPPRSQNVHIQEGQITLMKKTCCSELVSNLPSGHIQGPRWMEIGDNEGHHTSSSKAGSRHQGSDFLSYLGGTIHTET